jgi:hypothetical protein
MIPTASQAMMDYAPLLTEASIISEQGSFISERPSLATDDGNCNSSKFFGATSMKALSSNPSNAHIVANNTTAMKLETMKKPPKPPKSDKPKLIVHELPVTWKAVYRTAFIRKMLSHRDTEHKLKVLYDVLKAQRVRHMLRLADVKKALKGSSTVQVNTAGLQKFLKNPYNNVEGIDLVFNGLASGDFIQMRRV